MVAVELSTTSSLTELLSARARRTPRERLVLDVVGGLLVAVAVLWARPTGWVLWLAAAGCFSSYGIWALAEVRLLPRYGTEQQPHESRWRAVQGAAALCGLASFVLLLFSALGVALGSIKS